MSWIEAWTGLSVYTSKKKWRPKSYDTEVNIKIKQPESYDIQNSTIIKWPKSHNTEVNIKTKRPNSYIIEVSIIIKSPKSYKPEVFLILILISSL